MTLCIDLISLLNSRSEDTEWKKLNFITTDRQTFVIGLTSFFFNGDKALGIDKNPIVEICSATGTASTFLGALPGGQIFGVICAGFGVASSTAVIIFDNQNCKEFKNVLSQAFAMCLNNPNGDISLCYSHYYYTHYDFVPSINVNTWSNWSTTYINKYVNGRRFEVTKGIGYNDKIFDLADQGL